jgi:ABC-type sulfate/molybdate transport systems ATPase subunit
VATKNKMNLLEVKNLYSEQLLGGFALEDINLSIPVTKKIALMGQTGSGKSTLLKTIAGFIQHKSGSIFFDGEEALGPNFQLIAGVKGIAYLSQHFELRNNYRMEELFEYANNHFSTEEVNKLFAICNVAHLQKRKSTELSGGEKQRIALTRLLLTKPTLLILDEPYTNLDAIHTAQLKAVIEQACNEYNITCILCSHNTADILPWADELLVMQQGSIIQAATPNYIYNNPINEMVAGLLGDYVINNQFKHTTQTFLRPNNFEITTTGNYTGTIKACSYYGTYYKLLVDYEASTLLMYSINPYYKGSSILFNIVKTT